MFIFSAITTLLGGFWAKHSLKVYIGLAVAAVIAAVAIFIWFDIKRREENAAQAAIHALQVKQLEEQIKVVRQDQENQIKNQKLLNQRITAVKTDVQKRQNAMSQRDLHDEALTDAKKLEDEINASTTEQLKRLEDATK